jgi:hypothetical protein
VATHLNPVPLMEAGELDVERALAVRDACLGWLPFGGVLARLGDPVVRRWMRRASPYADEIDEVARSVQRPGIWLLHGAYLFGCTAIADETAEGPRLRRTLDWPFPGLGRLVEVVRRRSAAGEYLNVTWPGFVGVLTAVAPGRFAAAINQAPMRHRSSLYALRWSDYVLNALAGLRVDAVPPEHLLRQVFDRCDSFEEARHMLETAPVARPVLFTLIGCRPGERVVIERDGVETRTYCDDTTVANDWQEARAGWRPRCCGEGTPIDNNRHRRATLAAWAGRDGSDKAWVAHPVLNACTRVSVDMSAATGTLLVAGWEPDGGGSAARATEVTRFSSPPPCR